MERKKRNSKLTIKSCLQESITFHLKVSMENQLEVLDGYVYPLWSDSDHFLYRSQAFTMVCMSKKTVY